jgi:hypothetical protein
MPCTARKTLAGLVEPLARFEQRLAGDAADSQTGASQGGVLVDAANIQPQLRCPDCGDIPAGASANDYKIVVRHNDLLTQKLCSRSSQFRHRSLKQ